MTYIGNQTIGGSSSSYGEGHLGASRFQASSSFVATRIVHYFNATFGVGEKARFAIYDDDNDDPGNLLAETGEITGDGTVRWRSAQLTSSYSIVSGNYYHLVIHQESVADEYFDTEGGHADRKTSTYASGFPDPFGVPSTQDAPYLYSIYADDSSIVEVGDGNLSKGGAILEASDGTKITVFWADDAAFYIEVWKDIDGTPSLVDRNTVSNIHGGGQIGWIDAAIDSNDDIHVVSSCTTEQTRDVAYAVCDLTTGFGAWEEAADYTEQAPTNLGCAISIDSNDYPHILFIDAVKVAGSTQDNVYYDYNDGSWNGAEQVGLRDTKTDSYSQPQISHAPANDVEAFYYFVTDGDPAYNRRNGTWGGESVYTETDAVIGGVTITTGDTVYRYHTDTDEDIEENDVDTTYNADTTSNRISASLVNDSDRYIFYIDTSDDVHVISNDGGGWTDESAQQVGTYLRVISEWAYNNENQSGEINYIFDDGTNVYYDSFPLVTDSQINVSESIAVTDTPTVQHIPNPDVSEAVTVADTPTVAPILLEISVAEAIVVTDTPTVELPFEELDVTEAETVTVTDAPTASILLEADVAETITVTDTPTIGHIPNPTVSDNVVVNDIPNADILLETLIADTVGVTDAPTVSVEATETLEISVSENIIVTDTPEAVILLDVLTNDGVTVTDTPTVVIGVLPDLDITVSESITVADDASTVILLSIVAADAITVTDTPTVFVEAATALEVTALESITVSDTPTVDPILLEASTSDSVTVTDVITIEDIPNVSVSDTVIVTDVASAAIELWVTVAESVVVADTPTIEIPAQPDLEVTVSETITVGDTLTVDPVLLEVTTDDAVVVSDTPTVAPPDLNITVSEAITVSDTPIVTVEAATTLEITTNENVTVADTPIVGHIPNVSTADNVTVTDVPTLDVTIELVVTETVVVADSAVADIPVQPDLNVSVSETITVSDAASAYILLETTTTDSVTVTDTPLVGHIPNVSVTEPITVTDTPTANITVSITAAEAVTVADSTNAEIPVEPDLNVTVSENITVSDAAAIYFLLEAFVADAMSVVDSATISHIANISVSDPVSVVDTVSVDPVSVVVDVSENVSVTDTPTIEVEAEAALDISVSENISVADAVTSYLLVEAVTQDVVSVTDVPIVLGGANISVAETVAVADEPTVFVGFVSPLFVQVAEQVTVADVPVTLYIPIDLSVQDAVAILDVPNVLGGANIGVSETITVVEATNVYVGIPFGVKVDWLSVVLYIDQEMSRTAYVEQERVYNVER